MDAFIPSEYILNEIQKLDTYKRIAALETKEEVSDMRDELKDRFGTVPKACEHLLRISGLRNAAHRLGITEVRGRNGEISFTFKPDASIKTENIGALLTRHKKTLTLFAKAVPPVFTYRYRTVGEVGQDEKLLLEKTEKMIEEMTEYLL